MKDQFIPYEYAKMMKELGFDERSPYCYYSSDSKVAETYCKNSDMKIYISAPLYQQAEEWLWEKHRISIGNPSLERFKNTFHCYFDTEEGRRTVFNTPTSIYFKSPLTAHREGILKAIEYTYEQFTKANTQPQ